MPFSKEQDDEELVEIVEAELVEVLFGLSSDKICGITHGASFKNI